MGMLAIMAPVAIIGSASIAIIAKGAVLFFAIGKITYEPTVEPLPDGITSILSLIFC